MKSLIRQYPQQKLQGGRARAGASTHAARTPADCTAVASTGTAPPLAEPPRLAPPTKPEAPLASPLPPPHAEPALAQAVRASPRQSRRPRASRRTGRAPHAARRATPAQPRAPPGHATVNAPGPHPRSAMSPCVKIVSQAPLRCSECLPDVDPWRWRPIKQASRVNVQLIHRFHTLHTTRASVKLLSQSVSHYHTPSRELMAHAHSHSTLVFFFKCAADISASSHADASSSSSGRSSYFRMVFCSFHFLPIFLLAQIL